MNVYARGGLHRAAAARLRDIHNAPGEGKESRYRMEAEDLIGCDIFSGYARGKGDERQDEDL